MDRWENWNSGNSTPSISVLSLGVFVPIFGSFPSASMQFVCYNQQRYATAVVMLSYLTRSTVTSTFTCQLFCSRHCNQVSSTSRIFVTSDWFGRTDAKCPYTQQNENDVMLKGCSSLTESYQIKYTSSI